MKDRGELIEDAAYEGFCFGIDVVLQALEMEASHAPERRPRDCCSTRRA